MPGKKLRGAKLRGAHRMKENGYKLVSVWLDASEAEVITKAARALGKKLATYTREAAFNVAAAQLTPKGD